MTFYNTQMIASSGQIVTEGKYFMYGPSGAEMCYFRPSDGRYDFQKNQVTYYGFASSEKSGSTITIIYKGGSPLSPKFLFSTSITEPNLYKGVWLDPIYNEYIDDCYTCNNPDVTAVANNSENLTISSFQGQVFIPAFKISTKTEAAEIGGSGTNSNQCIKKSELSNYNVVIKDEGYLVDEQNYLNNQCVLKDDLIINGSEFSLQHDVTINLIIPGRYCYIDQTTGEYRLPIAGGGEVSVAPNGFQINPVSQYTCPTIYYLISDAEPTTSISNIEGHESITYPENETWLSHGSNGQVDTEETVVLYGDYLTIDCSDVGTLSWGNNFYYVVFDYGKINGTNFNEIVKSITNTEENLEIELHFGLSETNPRQNND